MTWDEVKELAPLYVIGALDEKTAHDLEVSLNGDTPEQHRVVSRWLDVAALLPDGASSIANEFNPGGTGINVNGVMYAFANVSLQSPNLNVTDVNFVVIFSTGGGEQPS